MTQKVYWVVRKDLRGAEISRRGPFPSLTCEKYGEHWNHQMAIAEAHNQLRRGAHDDRSRQLVYSEETGE